jgi:hypothetical protein
MITALFSAFPGSLLLSTSALFRHQPNVDKELVRWKTSAPTVKDNTLDPCCCLHPFDQQPAAQML